MDIVNLATFFLLLLTSLALLLVRAWRWRITALALMYLGVFVLVLPSWPLGLASVKLITGWMACAVLAFTRFEAADRDDTLWPTGLAFRVLAAVLVLLVVSGAAPSLSAWAASIKPNQAWGALMLMGLGLLSVGLSSQGFTIILGLLTIFAGFEILYAVVEASTLVAGLLAVINLGIALVGAYLMVAPMMETVE